VGADAPFGVPGDYRTPRRKHPLTWPNVCKFIEYKFYHSPVSDSATDRLLSAQIAGLVARHASATRLTGRGRAAAVAELAELAAGRGDLLAKCAGIGLGIHEGDLDEDRYIRAAQICIEAGADTTLIPHWLDVGRRQARDIAAKYRAGGTSG